MGWDVPVQVAWVDEEEGRVAVAFRLWREEINFELVLDEKGGWSPDPDTGHFLTGAEEVWQWLAMIWQGALNLEKEERARDVRELNARLKERTQGFLRRALLDRCVKGGA